MGMGKGSFRVRGADVGYEALAIGVVTSIGGFLFGYDTGQISGMQIFPDFINRFGQDQPDGTIAFNPTILSLLVSLMSLGSLFGALGGSYTNDWLGRRKSISVGVAFFVLGNIIQITAMNHWGHMTAGRAVAGIGIGIISVGVPLFQSETCPKEIRGAVVASYQFMITIGILVSNLVNFGVREIQESSASWRIVIGIGIAFAMILGTFVLFLPESPRWLMGQGKFEEARTSLARLRGLKDDPYNKLVELDYNDMYTSLKAQQEAGVGSWLDCFTGKGSDTPKVAWRTWSIAGVQFFQQWAGVNYFFYYGATIFQSAGVDDPLVTQIILGAVNVTMTIPGLYLIMRLGRRKCLIPAGIWQASVLLVFAAVATAIPPQENSTVGVVMIVMACLFIASFAAFLGPIPWVIMGESFPLRTRAKQASIATASNWLGNFMLSMLTPIADDGISYAFGFVFVACNLVGSAIVYFFIYETEALSLEDVDRMYSEPGLKPWQSSKWVPPGYRSRRDRIEGWVDGADDATRVDSAEMNARKGEKASKETGVGQNERIERV